jgi:autotransporter-associated beta strand protein
MATPAVAALLSFAQSGRAATLTLDADGMGTPPSAPGIWDQFSSNWYNGTSYTSWTANSDDAVIQGEAGTVYIKGAGLGANITHYNSPGTVYQLNTTGSTFTWGNTVDVNSRELLMLSTTAGTNLIKTGTGMFGFYVGTGGTPTGNWDIQNGTFKIVSDITGTTNRGINLSGAGSVFDISHSSISSGKLEGIGTVKLASNIVVGTVSGGRYQINTDGTSSTFGGKFTGTGRIEKRNVGVLTLTGTQNTFEGNWTIFGGLIIDGGDTLPNNYPVFVQSNSTLTINNSETIGSLGSGSPTNAGAAIVLNGGTLSIGSNAITAGNNQFPGQFVGSGLIKKIGSNTQLLATAGTTGTLTGSLAYSGKWEVDGGILGIAPTTGDQILGALPTSLQTDHITINGGTFAGTLTSTGFATMTLNANRGITVGAGGGGLSMYSSTLTSTLTVTGPLTGSANLNKGGGAVVLINSDNVGTYSGNWNVVDGALGTTTTATSTVTPLGTGSITLTGSALEILPGATSTSTTDIAVAPGASTLTYGAGAQLQYNHNTNNSVSGSLTIGNLARGTDGSLMILVGSTVANLGTVAGETIKVTGGVTNVNDVVPGVVGWTGPASNTADFLRYDATNGFVGATYNATDINASISATDTVSQNATGTLAASTALNALRVGSGGTVALDLNTNTVTLGSGSNPATLVLNPATTLSNGTVAFGGRPAVVYVGPTANPTSNVTFSGATSFTKTGSGTLSVNTPMSYSGKTYITSGTLLLATTDVIPTTSDVVLSGSSPLNSVGTLALGGNSQTINSLNATLQGQLDFGVNGTLKINGSGSSLFNGGATNGTGATTSTLWNSGTGTVTLGILGNAPNTGGVGLQGKAFGYNKLRVDNGGKVVINNSSYIPSNPTGGPVADVYYLDNGGTIEWGTSQLSSLSISAAGASTGTLGSVNRGIFVGAGGGRINVARYEEILFAQNTNDTAATSAASIISGAGTLTKGGAGLFRVGYGNVNFTGKWVVDGGGLQFQTDANGIGSSPNLLSSLGAAPGAPVSDGITLKNGAYIQSNNEGAIHPNRGITVGSGGGTLYGSSPLIINSPVVSASGGSLTIAGPTTSQNIDFEAVNPAFPTTLVNTGFIAFNADTSGGAITLDPTFEKISIGKHEGGDSTVNNAINMLPGGLIDIRVASTTVGVPGSILNGSGTGTLTLAGKISGAGSFFKGYDTSNGGNTLDGTVILSNNTNDFTGNLTISFGTVVATANNSLGAGGASGHTQIGPLGILSVKNNITSPERIYVGGTINNTDVNTITNTVQMTGDATIDTTLTGTSTTSTLKLTGGITGVHTLLKNGTGTGSDLEMKYIRATALGVGGGKVTITASGGANASTSVLRNPAGLALNLSGSYLLDLTDNKLILTDPAGTWNGSQYTDTTGLVATARNGGGWGGTTGITTTQTHATTGNYTSIGVSKASDARPNTVSETALWGGQTITGTDTLVMYTYGGDATLDGKINIDDYVRIDNGISAGLTGWSNGDFNYDGKVSIDDYISYIDANIGNQTGVFPTGGGVEGGGGVSGVSAVPEPASLGVLGIGAIGLMGSRRRRRTR